MMDSQGGEVRCFKLPFYNKTEGGTTLRFTLEIMNIYPSPNENAYLRSHCNHRMYQGLNKKINNNNTFYRCMGIKRYDRMNV